MSEGNPETRGNLERMTEQRIRFQDASGQDCELILSYGEDTSLTEIRFDTSNTLKVDRGVMKHIEHLVRIHGGLIESDEEAEEARKHLALSRRLASANAAIEDAYTDLDWSLANSVDSKMRAETLNMRNDLYAILRRLRNLEHTLRKYKETDGL